MQRIIPLPSRGVLQVGGADARSFLNKLVTQDVNQLSPSRALYSALLTIEGRYLSDFFIVDGGECLYLDLPSSQLAALAALFERYKMRQDVFFRDVSGTLYVFAIVGQGDEWQHFDLLPLEGTCRVVEDNFVFVDPRLQSLGVRLLAKDSTAIPVHHLPRGREDDYHFLRTRLGISEAPSDLMPGKSIILEHGFHELHGISWEKGCYTGQELMARTFYRGQVNKRAFPFTIEGPLPEAQSQIRHEDQVVGEVLSHAGDVGMALLRVPVAQRCVAENLPLTLDRATLRPYIPSWMTLGLEEKGAS